MKRTKTVSLFLCILFAFYPLISSYAAIARTEAEKAFSKISECLLNEYKNQDNKLVVYIWFKDIPEEEIEMKATEISSITLDEIEELDSKVPDANIDLNSAKGDLLFKEYLESTKQMRLNINKMLGEYIMTRRNVATELYSKNNTYCEKDCGINEKEIIYSSKYSPVLIASLSLSEVEKIAKNENVVSVEFRGDMTSFEESYYGEYAIDADYLKVNVGLTGYGVKVGVLDSGIVWNHSEFSSTTITRLDAISPDDSNHATNVTRIIAGSNGLAQDCHIYSIAHFGFEEMVETLISNGVSVINMSIGYPRTSGEYYNATEKWLDHVGYQHKVSFVKSAGNNGNSATITSPGLSYNSITVGSYSTNNTTPKSDDYLESSSCGGNGGQSGCAKPDVISPTEHDFGGATSMAAPFVTGVIALLFEYKPIMKNYPALTKAVITASCDRKFNESIYNGLTPIEGAGSLNAKRAFQVLFKGRYQYGTFYSSEITKTFSVTSSDTSITVGLAWLKPNTASGSSHSSTNVGLSANLKLQVLLPNGSSAGYSNITNSSVEMIHFDVSSYGTYTIKVNRVDTNTNGVPYALAWW